MKKRRVLEISASADGDQYALHHHNLFLSFYSIPFNSQFSRITSEFLFLTVFDARYIVGETKYRNSYFQERRGWWGVSNGEVFPSTCHTLYNTWWFRESRTSFIGVVFFIKCFKNFRSYFLAVESKKEATFDFWFLFHYFLFFFDFLFFLYQTSVLCLRKFQNGFKREEIFGFYSSVFLHLLLDIGFSQISPCRSVLRSSGPSPSCCSNCAIQFFNKSSN